MDAIKQTSQDFAESVEIMAELGFVGSSEESRRFREMWRKLDRIDKERIHGIIYGATMGSAMNKPDKGARE